MYDFNVGVLNDILVRIGIIDAPVAWLARPDLALAAIMAALVWQGFPFFAITILAGLQTIPAELYEAAEIDGANRSQMLRHITLPSIADVIATALLRLDHLGGELPRRHSGHDRRRSGLCRILSRSTPSCAPTAAWSSATPPRSRAILPTLLLLTVVWLYVRRASQDLDR